MIIHTILSQKASKNTPTKYGPERIPPDPRKWHQQVKHITGNNKSDISIPFPGVDDGDHVTIANKINDQFVGVSSHIPPLDMCALEAYSPAIDPSPLIYSWEVYADLRKVKATDGIPSKLVQEFAYELSPPWLKY